MHKLNQHASKLHAIHLQAIYSILIYLNTTLGQKHLYFALSSLTLKAFSDAERVSYPDTYKLITDLCVFSYF